jgi:hypothetical protein
MNDASESRDLVPAESTSLPAVETRRADRPIVVPAIVATAGDGAARRFLEFFAVTIDNPNTRAAYFHACRRFFAWCDRREDIVDLVDVEPMHVAAYIRGLGSRPSSSTSPRSACCSIGSSSARWSQPIRRMRCAGRSTSSRPARPRRSRPTKPVSCSTPSISAPLLVCATGR